MGKFWKKTWTKKKRKITGFFERTLSFLLELFSGKWCECQLVFHFCTSGLISADPTLIPGLLRRQREDRLLSRLACPWHQQPHLVPRLSLSLLHSMAGCKRDVHHQPVHIWSYFWIVVGVWCVRYPIEFAIVTIAICYFITSDHTEAFATKTNFANELEHHPPPRKKHEVSLIVSWIPSL